MAGKKQADKNPQESQEYTTVEGKRENFWGGWFYDDLSTDGSAKLDSLTVEERCLYWSLQYYTERHNTNGIVRKRDGKPFSKRELKSITAFGEKRKHSFEMALDSLLNRGLIRWVPSGHAQKSCLKIVSFDYDNRKGPYGRRKTNGKQVNTETGEIL